jgi:hypothetical protein
MKLIIYTLYVMDFQALSESALKSWAGKWTGTW